MQPRDLLIVLQGQAANAPALALYASLGFGRVAERTVAGGLAYVELCLPGNLSARKNESRTGSS
jgi:hypothetical protein